MPSALTAVNLGKVPARIVILLLVGPVQKGRNCFTRRAKVIGISGAAWPEGARMAPRNQPRPNNPRNNGGATLGPAVSDKRIPIVEFF